MAPPSATKGSQVLFHNPTQLAFKACPAYSFRDDDKSPGEVAEWLKATVC